MKKFILKFTPYILIGFLIFEVIITLLAPVWVQKYYGFLEVGIITYILLYAFGLVTAYILINSILLSKILLNYRFEIKYLENLRRINYSLLFLVIVSLLLSLITHLLSTVVIMFTIIVILCLLVALQEVFKSGVALQNEMDHTV